jgi:peptidyl-prolyl cis-trans isomerase SurA
MRGCLKLMLIGTAVALCLGYSTLVRAETLERIVAVVNGDIILYGDVQEQVKLLTKLSPNVNLQDPEQKAKAEREILTNLIRQRLAEQEVKRLKIKVSKGEVDKAFEDMKRENGFTDAQLEATLSREGQSLKDFREKIRQELERSRLMERAIKSKVVISDEQVNARLQSPQPAGEGKERRRLAVIYLQVPENADAGKSAQTETLARKISGNLKDGTDFAKLAREYSQGPGAQEGGDIGYVSPEELSPEIGKAVRNLSAGGVTDVIKTPGGFYLVKLLDVRKDKPTEGETPVKDKVRKQLYQEEANRVYETWIKDLESKAFIKVNL